MDNRAFMVLRIILSFFRCYLASTCLAELLSLHEEPISSAAHQHVRAFATLL
jgi:hypothetical protein